MSAWNIFSFQSLEVAAKELRADQANDFGNFPDLKPKQLFSKNEYNSQVPLDMT